MSRTCCLAFLLLFTSSKQLSPAPEQNGSSTASAFKPEPTRISWKNVAYAMEGFVAVGGNLLIVLAVMTTKALRRKELMIIAGLAFSEFIYGVGVFTAGIRRGWLEATGYHNHPSTPWHCMWVIHNPFFIAGSACEAIMLLMTSVDRLLAIKTPVWYWKQHNKYAWICLSLAYSLSAGFLLLTIVGAYLKPMNPAVTLACVTGMALPSWMTTLRHQLQAVGGWGSVVIYVLVVYFYREQGKKLPSERLKEARMKRQRKMTKTIGICVTITVLTLCISRSVMSTLSFLRTNIHPQTYYAIQPMISAISNINIMANVFVFSCRQWEIRAAIVRILTFGRVKLSVDKKPQGIVRVAPQPEPNEVP